MNKKPIDITLFHASWCGHCVRFMPEWERLKKTNNLDRFFNFNQYESNMLDSLDHHTKTINGQQISGFPTIKISVFDKQYEYDDHRNIHSILNFVKTKIKQK